MNGEACTEEELYFQIVREMESGLEVKADDFETEFNLGDSDEMIECEDLMTKSEWVDLINEWYSHKKILSYNQKE